MLPMYHFTSSSQKVTKSTGFLSSSCIEQIWFHVINTAVLLWTLLQWILHLNLSLVYFIFYTFQSALLLKSQHLFPFWTFSPLYIWFLIIVSTPRIVTSKEKQCSYLSGCCDFLQTWHCSYTLMNWTTGVKTLQSLKSPNFLNDVQCVLVQCRMTVYCKLCLGRRSW